MFENAQGQCGSFLFEGVQGGRPEPVNAIAKCVGVELLSVCAV